ncbi:glycoside hydrolase family 3 N-terminal domain-containing protein [Micromonospora sp. WMMD1102]|uniref:glycoside hydrolase family 3 protein n=1 Tax=Micromonospora sp. WMMD1102 TaxID=3016105 RepID=UPI0024150E61|nr:glycoside hydrolase family 3 protein [Micromonospora sp. WMMD1102]MDG4784566.1 glycoside hydrolase family 3 N-terminal domain-containing protein [Micromonospora sp. WMMD1102]
MRTRLLASTVATVLLVAGTAAPPAHGTPPTHGTPSTVDRLVARMSLPEKVGQLFASYVYGGSATAPNASDAAANRQAYGVEIGAEVVAKYHLGGVIYFTWSHNLDSPRQIATLSNELQASAAASGPRIPLLISTDQEHGVVQRLPAPATLFPGNMALGAGRSLPDAYTAARITGRELRAVGIGQAWAPSADVNVNPANPVIGVRSFGSDPLLVAGMTAAQVVGFQSGAGVSVAAKHFPGHGDTRDDSHTALPVIHHSRAEWQRLDAPPFQAAIAAGVDTIMTAHIVVPSLDDSGDPATLSAPVLTGLLRERLGFRGVVVTDSLAMAGVRQKYGDDRVPVLALKAGADLLLMPPNLDLAIDSVLAAVASGELTESRIDESVRRILTLKQRRGVLDGVPTVDPAAAERVVGQPAHQAALREVTDRTVTALRNDAELLPLSRRSGSGSRSAAGAGSGSGSGAGAGDRSILVTGWNSSAFDNVGTLAAGLAGRGNRTTALPTGLPNDAKIAEAVAAAEANDLTVVLTQKAFDTTVTDPNARQQKLVHALAATGRPVAVVAVRDAYDVGHFDDVPTQLATFGYTKASMEALTRVLVGEVAPRGKLPVGVPDPADPGTVRYPYGHGLTWRLPR